ncbi:MAG: hypothetical protein RLZZ528_434 [Pseudomonadota bacterium]
MASAGPMTSGQPAPDAENQPVRDAATILLIRDTAGGPAVLMGQRGAGAVFMPSKYVFPGGRVDAADQGVPFASPLHPACQARLGADAPDGLGPALAAAALRELAEETGLRLGRPGTWPEAAHPDWHPFATRGLLPDAGALHYIFRAITPPGRTRRFDARFFMAAATALADDPDDFAAASGELANLAWVPLATARQLDLPFITTIVIAEAAALIASGQRPASVPFFDNSGPTPAFRRIA